ncbi:MAG: DUF5666 domain-containing protein [Terracidiphilus sp.]|jgi:hypothetical protein
MKIRLISSITLLLAFATALAAQDAPATPPAGQPPAQGQGTSGWQGRGQRGDDAGRRGWGDFGDLAGRGIAGTVTEAAADHYTVKTDAGESYVVHFSANTRILKQTGQKPGEGPGGGQGGMRQRQAPEPIKSTDIKAGDAVAALGEVDSAAKSVGAITVMLIDPERAKQMREQRANYGKTWLMGKVTAINETTVSLTGALDNAAHAFQADENTAFRKRREPITLADIQVGDMVRAEGAIKGTTFIATSVAVMGPPQGGAANAPHDAPPAPAPQPSATQTK